MPTFLLIGQDKYPIEMGEKKVVEAANELTAITKAGFDKYERVEVYWLMLDGDGVVKKDTYELGSDSIKDEVA